MSADNRTLWGFCHDLLSAEASLAEARDAMNEAAIDHVAAQSALLAAMRRCGLESINHDGRLVRISRCGPSPRIVVESPPLSYSVALPIDDDPDDEEVRKEVEALTVEFQQAIAEIGPHDAAWAFQSAVETINAELLTPDRFDPLDPLDPEDDEEDEDEDLDEMDNEAEDEYGDDDDDDDDDDEDTEGGQR